LAGRLLHLLLVTSCAMVCASCSGQKAAAPLAVPAGVQVIQVTAPATATLSSRKGSYSFTVKGGEWVDTGVTLAAGDRVEFTTSGTLALSDGRSITPDGLTRGWKDVLRVFPVNSANVGSLAGRIGDKDASVPFNIGATKQMDVTTTGELYLCANLSSDLTANSGSMSVKMKLSKTPTAGPVAAVPDIGLLISPALFNDIPRRVADQQGNPGDMVNFAVVGTKDQVEKAFAAAGWVTVDKTTEDAIVHGLLATLAHEAYVQMPMSTLYLFGRAQDLSFARADPLAVAAVRHHLRVWQTPQTVNGMPLWVGSATHDNGFEKDQRNGQITHHIDPKIDTERDFIEQSFSSAGVLRQAAYVTPSDPLKTARTATGGSFESDGRIVVMLLR